MTSLLELQPVLVELDLPCALRCFPLLMALRASPPSSSSSSSPSSHRNAAAPSSPGLLFSHSFYLSISLCVCVCVDIDQTSVSQI